MSGHWRFSTKTVLTCRFAGVRATRRPTAIVDPPDPVALVGRAQAVGPYAVQARIRVPRPLAAAVQLATIVEIGAGAVAPMAGWLAALPVAVEVLDPPELRTAARDHAIRVAEANG